MPQAVFRSLQVDMHFLNPACSLKLQPVAWSPLPWLSLPRLLIEGCVCLQKAESENSRVPPEAGN